ncbi:hypothetical protein HanIR_Chr11g0523601 [Helianthus annuus]|nr:hypothetical protein HanIR_Chr11g0523601 [Helianthus annuus]
MKTHICCATVHVTNKWSALSFPSLQNLQIIEGSCTFLRIKSTVVVSLFNGKVS